MIIDNLIGTEIGDYEIVRQLGRGAMGVVFKAREKTLDRTVALKILPLRLSTDQDFIYRFYDEARAAAQINHPNVVTIFTVGNDDDTHFISMEYVRGLTLARVIQRHRRLEVRHALEIASQIAAGLDAAHHRGIFHRDVKPQNIMIGDDGRVKVLDFGIAKVQQYYDDPDRPPTLFGTPAYMSPEQCQGLHVDARSDIFSLGIVLYEMIAGEIPFGGSSSTSVAYAIVSNSTPSITKQNPQVIPSVVAVIEKALAKNPNHRYASAAMMKGDLDAAIETFDKELAAHVASLAEPAPRSGSGSDSHLEREGKLRLKPSGSHHLTLPTLHKIKRSFFSRFAGGTLRAKLKNGAIAGLACLLLVHVSLFILAMKRHSTHEVLRGIGHAEEVFGVAFSPDGRYAFSGGADKTVRAWNIDPEKNPATIWNSIFGKHLYDSFELEGHTNYVYAVAASPNGRQLFSGSGDSTIDLWDLKTGMRTRHFSGHKALVHSIAVSPDGKRLLSGGMDKVARLWDTSSGKELTKLKGHTSMIRSVAFSPDGSRAATGSADQSIRVWDLKKGQQVQVLKGHEQTVTAVAFMADGKRIISASWDGTVRLWDADSGRETGRLDNAESDLMCMAVSPDGRRVLSGGSDDVLHLWNLETLKEERRFSNHGSDVLAAAFSPDGKQALSGGANGVIRLWELPGDAPGGTTE